MATDSFDFVSALEQELEIQYEGLVNLLSRPDVRPEDGSTEAIVDLADLLHAYTRMREAGATRFGALSDVDSVIDERLTNLIRKILAAHQEGVFSLGVSAELQGKVFDDYRRDILETADFIRAYQVAAHLPEHILEESVTRGRTR